MTVRKGDRWAVIGPNGAGKTTLFRAISGEVYPTRGSIRLHGADVTRAPPYRRARRGLGRTYQVTNLFPDLTVEENVLIAANGCGRTRFRCWWPVRMTGELGQRVDGALGQVGLSQRRRHHVQELSHGEQRQVELALALAGRPRILLLDEPAAGLAASERATMRQLIEDLPRDLTIVLIEHDMQLALDLVEQVVCLDNGKTIAAGTPDQIRANEQVQMVYLRSD
ncbi:MAG: ATP-binding cassette domain-containing protein [Streptosporangiales bacterium]|nr:ATP-binding cassette domain-containing protein [Streptosporangiales bacterium]